MLSVIEVKCPHCGALGQILVPPLGSVVVGPCPICDEMIVFFGGEVLPLETELMRNGPLTKKKKHLFEVLMRSVREKVESLVEEEHVSAVSLPQHRSASALRPKPSIRNYNAPIITKKDVADFVRIDLNLLDKKEHFKKFFETKKV